MTRLLAIWFACLIVVSAPAVSRAEPIAAAQIQVVSADTIRLRSRSRDTRLVGLKAPETKRAMCPNEKLLGAKAIGFLRDLVASTDLDLQLVKCACRAGSEGTPKCNQSRSCGILKSNDQDVSEILISEGLAVQFKCGLDRCPPSPKPWCAAQQRRPKRPLGINLQTFSELRVPVSLGK